MAIKVIRLVSGDADASGDAVVTVDTLPGKILSARIDYDGTSASGTDVYITDGDSQSIVSVEDTNTSVTVYPRTYAQDEEGTDLTYDATRLIPTEFVVHTPLTLTVDDQTEGKGVTVTVVMEV